MVLWGKIECEYISVVIGCCVVNRTNANINAVGCYWVNNRNCE